MINRGSWGALGSEGDFQCSGTRGVPVVLGAHESGTGVGGHVDIQGDGNSGFNHGAIVSRVEFDGLSGGQPIQRGAILFFRPPRSRNAYFALLGSNLYYGNRVWIQIDLEIRRVLKPPALWHDRVRLFERCRI
jgi:hypothetical protein